MTPDLPEPYFHHSSQGGVIFAKSAWIVDIYRHRKHWFPKRVATAAGWTENEAWNNAIRKLPASDLAAIQ